MLGGDAWTLALPSHWVISWPSVSPIFLKSHEGRLAEGAPEGAVDQMPS